MASGSTLFTIISTPINYFEYTGRLRTDVPTAVLSLPPLVIITPCHCHPSLISHPLADSLFPLYTHPLILVTTTFITQNDGGGSVAINKYQADNPDNFIKVVVDHSIGDALTG